MREETLKAYEEACRGLRELCQMAGEDRDVPEGARAIFSLAMEAVAFAGAGERWTLKKETQVAGVAATGMSVKEALLEAAKSLPVVKQGGQKAERKEKKDVRELSAEEDISIQYLRMGVTPAGIDSEILCEAVIAPLHEGDLSGRFLYWCQISEYGNSRTVCGVSRPDRSGRETAKAFISGIGCAMFIRHKENGAEPYAVEGYVPERSGSLVVYEDECMGKGGHIVWHGGGADIHAVPLSFENKGDVGAELLIAVEEEGKVTVCEAKGMPVRVKASGKEYEFGGRWEEGQLRTAMKESLRRQGS